MSAEPIDFPGYKDGEDGPDDTYTSNATIEPVLNGFVVRMSTEDGDEFVQVYNYESRGKQGPMGMINDLIYALGIETKVTPVKERRFDNNSDS